MKLLGVSIVLLLLSARNLVLSVKSGNHAKSAKSHAPAVPTEEQSIEDVDEDRIDEIVADGDKNLVIIFYDKQNRCPSCRESLRELEEIDDDLEAAHIEVVKTDDKNVAKELGIHTFPALVYYRRRNPILYDGDFTDSEVVLRWVRAHSEVATADLDDDDFEDRTDSATPNEGALDWFVMFYNSKEASCNAYVPVWEAVAHKLRGLVHIGKLDISESDDVAERFKVDEDDDCPTFLMFHRGKMFRYKDSARDEKSFTSFALHRFKEQRGHRVPDPPTLLEEIYEDIKEELEDIVEEHNFVVMGVLGAVGAVIFGIMIYCSLKSYRNKKSQKID